MECLETGKKLAEKIVVFKENPNLNWLKVKLLYIKSYLKNKGVNKVGNLNSTIFIQFPESINLEVRISFDRRFYLFHIN